LYTNLGRQAALAALCAACADAARDARERADWQRRLGDALAADGCPARAERAYQQAHAAVPVDDDARSALCAPLRARGDAPALAAQLAAWLPRAGARTTALLRELAELHEGPLAAPAEALAHWRRLWALDPTAEAPRERAIALAENLGRLDEALAM